MWRLALVVTALCTQPFASHAMDFSVLQPGNPRVVISAVGQIQLGDDRKLHDFVGGLPAASSMVGIVLNSPGGNLLEGVRLAITVASSHVNSAVVNVCASACFLVFAAGLNKIVFDNARLGVHSASDLDGGESELSQATTTRMARLAAALNVPAPIVAKMVTTPPDQVAWLSRSELQSLPGIQFAETGTGAPDGYEPGSALRTGGRNATSPTPPTAYPRVPLPSPSQTASAATVPANGIEQSASYIAGRAARGAWEQWFASLTGDARAGAAWWAEHRSTAVRDHLSCENRVGMPVPFLSACAQARSMLVQSDQRRRADTVFKAGWNSL